MILKLMICLGASMTTIAVIIKATPATTGCFAFLVCLCLFLLLFFLERN